MSFSENKFLTEEELKKQMDLLNQHQGERDSILLRLILFTGARTAEVIKVRKKDLAGGAVFITAVKKSNNRNVPVPAKFFRELQDYAKDLNDDDLLFPFQTRHVRRIWDQWRVVKKGAHCLRHTFGVRLYDNRKDIHATKTALGHRNIQNTMVYLDFVEGQEKLKNSIKGMWKCA